MSTTKERAVALRDAMAQLSVDAHIEELSVVIILAWPDHENKTGQSVVATNNPIGLDDLLDMVKSQQHVRPAIVRMPTGKPS